MNKPIAFDISWNPPSSDEISQWREAAEQGVKTGRLRERVLMVFLLLIVGPLPFYFSSLDLSVSGGTLLHLVGEALVAGVLAAVGGLLTLIVYAVGVDILPRAWFSGVHSTNSFNLSDVRYPEHPQECEKFVSWCETDSSVKAYQNKLVALGRRPVYGEYLAAMRWIAEAEKRHKAEAAALSARQACERLSAAI